MDNDDGLAPLSLTLRSNSQSKGIAMLSPRIVKKAPSRRAHLSTAGAPDEPGVMRSTNAELVKIQATSPATRPSIAMATHPRW